MYDMMIIYKILIAHNILQSVERASRTTECGFLYKWRHYRIKEGYNI